MLRAILRSASAIDRRLHDRLGRTYGIFLSVGLIADIVHRVSDAASHVEEKHRLIGMTLAVVMEFALLLHQLSELHEWLTPHRKGDQAEH